MISEKKPKNKIQNIKQKHRKHNKKRTKQINVTLKSMLSLFNEVTSNLIFIVLYYYYYSYYYYYYYYFYFISLVVDAS